MIALIPGTSTPYGSVSKKKISLNSKFKKDLAWWYKFLPMWNGCASFFEIDWTRSDVFQLCTDASATLGYGAYFSGAWFNGR